MNQAAVNANQQEWLKVLGKGMVTIPKKWREELGLEEGDIVKAKKMGNRVVIESSESVVPYRTFSDQEIDEWLKADKLPRTLAKKIDQKLKSFNGD